MNAANTVEHKAQQGTKNEAPWPASVKNVQPMGFVFGEEGCGKRVDDRFAGTVAQSKQPSRQIQAPEGAFLAVSVERPSSHEGDDCRRRVKGECQAHEWTVSDFIGEKRQHNNGDAETSEATTRDGAEFRLGEAEFGGPVSEDRTAHREPNTCRDKRQEAGPEQNHFIRADMIMCVMTGRMAI